MMMMHLPDSLLQQMELQSTRFQGTASLKASGIWLYRYTKRGQ